MPFLHRVMSYANNREVGLQAGPGDAPVLQAEELSGEGSLASHHSPTQYNDSGSWKCSTAQLGAATPALGNRLRQARVT